jgi:hypothetical protein
MAQWSGQAGTRNLWAQPSHRPRAPRVRSDARDWWNATSCNHVKIRRLRRATATYLSPKTTLSLRVVENALHCNCRILCQDMAVQIPLAIVQIVGEDILDLRQRVHLMQALTQFRGTG